MGDVREKIADICDAEIQSGDPSCYVLADTILAALPSIIADMVEPLEWEEYWENGVYHKAGIYDILEGREWSALSRLIQDEHTRMGKFDNLALAIAAANAHHRATTLKALGMKEGE